MLNHIDLKQILILDIETVSEYPAFEELPAHLASLWEEKTKYQRRNGETAADYYEKAAIWAEFGKIICIAVGRFDQHEGERTIRIKSFIDHDEKALLLNFIALLDKQASSTILCAHNGKEFDFPYLCRRMLINNLPIPTVLQLSGKKPWEVNLLDTMELWKFGDYKHYTSLNLLAALFHIPSPKDDLDGSQVGRVYWVEKDLHRIKNYCQEDVITTAQLLLRFKGQPFVPKERLICINPA